MASASASERSERTLPRSPRVAVMAVGDPESTATWSGVTAGVIAGLREAGVDVRGIDLSLPPPLERALLVAAAARTRNRYDAEGAALTARRRTLLAGRALRTARPDATIQIGTTFALPSGARFVTLEDMTLRQGSVVHPVFRRMSTSAIETWERRRREIYSRAAMCAAASHWTGDSLAGDYGVPAGRVAVVGFGANHRLSPSERDWSVPRYLFVGLDWERKGGPLVLRAFARVAERLPGATLDVVGEHPPLELPGVRGHGVLAPTRDRDRALLVDLFADATCFVMPSATEPFGIAYVEAASAGVASIATSVGGPRDVIGLDGGIIVEPGGEEELLAAMLRLADPQTTQSMGAAALERSKLYTWPKVAERLLRALGLQLPDRRPRAKFL
jgi:glycosyltransferase involved in cell wall biosynthesis